MKKGPKVLVCRYCGDECDATNRDVLSAWTHNHPSVCDHRTDSVPSLNGVHVGDVWRNLHTKEEREITELRLGGAGVYTDREPVVVLGDRGGMGGWPMWSLVEHWEPISRPGVYPVPWTRSKRWKGRSALLKWRGGGIRGKGRRSRRQHAYWSSYHTIEDYISGWSTFWQHDPMDEERKEIARRMIASATEMALDPFLATWANNMKQTWEQELAMLEGSTP